ncbi:hypothetical protein ASD24_24680 [Paenibacillus sp. Root52]|uniref:hypothetical protein n=1 Tax=Paenibacillus sp. Root52 TaxID=1736552 RepID=UPI000702103A|nr:hypothetical protein [Paenibacillus sp. Root52]KQY90994.1 hypothetical protein ASD24_24680 [Paenibacillus sp. Root52]
MTKYIELYICKICSEYCDTEDCYVCDEPSGVLTKREDRSEQDIADIKERLRGIQQVKLFLSSFGDAPAEIDTIEYSTEKLFSLLQTNKFVFNGISAITVGGEMQNCVGVAFLEPVEIPNNNEPEPIYGLMILTD